MGRTTKELKSFYDAITNEVLLFLISNPEDELEIEEK
jgi:hypothetical protein